MIKTKEMDDKTKKKCKMSMFNILFEEEGRFFICNTLRGGVHEIDENTYRICNLVQNGGLKTNQIPTDLAEGLSGSGYIVQENDDVEAINKLRYLKLLKSFQSERLTLIIAPTLYCNFACPYCYEKDLPRLFMKDEIIDDLISFIKAREKSFKQLEICWHGGEPLSAINVIDKILKRIDSEICLKISRHSIVTNGYLINKKVYKCFSDHPLDYIQITIDGGEVTHNQNRISKDGKPTFNTIIANVDELIKELPLVNIGIRMNVHKGNVDEFIPLYEELSERWKTDRINIYPAFVMDSQSCRVPCFNSVEKTSFLYSIYKKIGVKYSDINMRLKTGDCTAIYENSYVIDPDGGLFKCWADVGLPEMRVGDLKRGVLNHSLVEKYILSSDKFTDKKCLNCSIFPICDGGCNRSRVSSDFYTKDICPLSPEFIAKCTIL